MVGTQAQKRLFQLLHRDFFIAPVSANFGHQKHFVASAPARPGPSNPQLR